MDPAKSFDEFCRENENDRIFSEKDPLDKYPLGVYDGDRRYPLGVSYKRKLPQ
jgi:hypothetical protein